MPLLKSGIAGNWTRYIAQKYREDVEAMEMKLRENTDTYKRELARLKKANKELLDQLTAGDDDDL